MALIRSVVVPGSNGGNMKRFSLEPGGAGSRGAGSLTSTTDAADGGAAIIH